MTLRDDFENGVNAELWPEVYGADTMTGCSVVVSGRALTFYKVRGASHFSAVSQCQP